MMWSFDKSAQKRCGVLVAIALSSMVLVAPGGMADEGGGNAPSDDSYESMLFEIEEELALDTELTEAGELDDGGTETRTLGDTSSVPYDLKAAGYPAQFTKVSAGFFHVVALGRDKKVYTWGSNRLGALGSGKSLSETAHRYVPEAISLPENVEVKDIATGDHFSFALTSGGDIYAWGDNEFGQLGNETREMSSVPVRVKAPENVKFAQISTFGDGGYGITEDGSLYAWGRNVSFSADDGTISDALVPVHLIFDDGVSVASVTGGANVSIALSGNGNAYVWDYKSSLFDKGGRVPTLVDRLPVGNIVQVDASQDALFARDAAGAIYAWGKNDRGVTGTGVVGNVETPTLVKLPSGVKARELACSGWSCTAITGEGVVYAWGHNNYGQLGTEGRNESAIPVKASMPKDASLNQITGGVFSHLGLGEDGFIYGVGSTAGGTLGVSAKSRFVSVWTKVVFQTETNHDSKPNPKPTDPLVSRIAGANRYETSLALNQKHMRVGAPVFVVTGATFPDALSVGPAVRAMGGSMVLTKPNQMDQKMVDLIKAREPSFVYIVGQTASVSQTVQTQLEKTVPTKNRVIRCGGADRYETSLIISRMFFPVEVDNIWLATGTDFPDALTGAAAGGATGGPVILVNGSGRAKIPPQVLTELRRHKVNTVHITGGYSTIGGDIDRELVSSGYKPVRHHGADRYETNEIVNQYLDTTFPGREVRSVWIAAGSNFPDALSVGAIAGYPTGRLVLSNGSCLPNHAWNKWISGKQVDVVLTGGVKSLSKDVADLQTCQ